MYQVIARKYRPQSFADVVNQEHVKTTLENAIAQNRIAHGYIFSGQRGTGKTTVARILARCLNCIDGPTNHPCGVCASCVEIAAGGAVDVIEIDAASNRGINEMRELRENVRYRPSRDRYKVFIIDEAHQITSEAFNALLKTIEEPPSWVVFVLATTEAHKIPATIASRCQHFSFRSVDFEALIERMDWICRQEGIEAGTEALSVLAQAGEGSVRDSLSALDQAIACCGSKLDAAQVRSLLGGFSLDSLHRVTEALTASSPAQMLAIVEDLERNGSNLQHFSREVARYFRNLLVAKVGDVKLIPASAQERERLTQIAGPFSEEDLTRYLQLSLDLFTDLQASLQPRFHLELGLIRMVQAGRLISIEDALAGLGGAPSPPVTPPAPRAPTATPTPTATATQARMPAPPARPSPFELDRAKKEGRPPDDSTPPASDADWKERLHSTLMEIGMPFTADGVEHSSVVASAAELQFTTPEEFMLGMKPDDINQAVRRILGRPMKIKIITGQGASEPSAPVKPQKAPENETSARALANPEVQRFQEVFGGQIRTVRNLKE
jgi:DNA polymerase III subunit gamma/tau